MARTRTWMHYNTDSAGAASDATLGVHGEYLYSAEIDWENNSTTVYNGPCVLSASPRSTCRTSTSRTRWTRPCRMPSRRARTASGFPSRRRPRPTTSCPRRAANRPGARRMRRHTGRGSRPTRKVRRRASKRCSRSTSAPAVTRERLYIEAVEEVLARSNKVLLDTSGNGNLIYRPIDKILENRVAPTTTGSGSARTAVPAAVAEPVAEIEATTTRSREDLRTRGGRQ